MDNTANYKNLVVFQKAKDLFINISLYFSKKYYPKTQAFVILQLFRATSSIGANIAEGYGRYYDRSYRQFLSIAGGSAFEVDYWLVILIELKLFDQTTFNVFISKNSQVVKMLTTIMKKLERRTQS